MIIILAFRQIAKFSNSVCKESLFHFYTSITLEKRTRLLGHTVHRRAACMHVYGASWYNYTTFNSVHVFLTTFLNCT